MRTIKLGLALVSIAVLSGPALADATIKVDRVYGDAIMMHVLARVHNTSTTSAGNYRVICDLFASDGSAVGRGVDMVENVEPGATVISAMVASPPPDHAAPKSAVCRIAE